jgi:hypothetical protein
MENNQQKDIDFIIQLQMLSLLLSQGLISEKEHTDTVNKLRAKHNCKLIVTSENF